MTTLSTSSKTADPTYDTMLSTLWSNVEANAGIICACLPTLKKPLSSFYRRWLAPRSNSSSERAGSSRTLRGREEGFRVIGMGGMGRRMEGEEVSMPRGEIQKRTDVRVQRCDDKEGIRGGQGLVELGSRVRGFSGEVERMYPDIVHLV
ncbi:MAG: hypothetical protein Q9209_004997 [Squamulea sp. 1 TL-2023]